MDSWNLKLERTKTFEACQLQEQRKEIIQEIKQEIKQQKIDEKEIKMEVPSLGDMIAAPKTIHQPANANLGHVKLPDNIYNKYWRYISSTKEQVMYQLQGHAKKHSIEGIRWLTWANIEQGLSREEWDVYVQPPVFSVELSNVQVVEFTSAFAIEPIFVAAVKEFNALIHKMPDLENHFTRFEYIHYHVLALSYALLCNKWCDQVPALALMKQELKKIGDQFVITKEMSDIFQLYRPRYSEKDSKMTVFIPVWFMFGKIKTTGYQLKKDGTASVLEEYDCSSISLKRTGIQLINYWNCLKSFEEGDPTPWNNLVYTSQVNITIPPTIYSFVEDNGKTSSSLYYNNLNDILSVSSIHKCYIIGSSDSRTRPKLYRCCDVLLYLKHQCALHAEVSYSYEGYVYMATKDDIIIEISDKNRKKVGRRIKPGGKMFVARCAPDVTNYHLNTFSIWKEKDKFIELHRWWLPTYFYDDYKQSKINENKNKEIKKRKEEEEESEFWSKEDKEYMDSILPKVKWPDVWIKVGDKKNKHKLKRNVWSEPGIDDDIIINPDGDGGWVTQAFVNIASTYSESSEM